MAYQVDWEGGVITIPLTDLTLLSVGKYELDLDEFRRKCRALEWSFEGLSYPEIIEFNTQVDTGDFTLASVILIVNGYTVTFEDGQYAVVFVGANTNLHNFTNVNQVSIRTNNSGGLVVTETSNSTDVNVISMDQSVKDSQADAVWNKVIP